MERGNDDLLRAVKEGDRAAFDAIHARFNPRLHRFVARLLRGREPTEDVLQEVWMRFAANAWRLDERTAIGAWLFTVARNLSASRHRWHAVSSALRSTLTGNMEGSSAPTPFDLSTAREDHARLEAALGRLSYAYREILLLVGVEGFPHEEVARILALRPDAMRKRLSRARAALAALLERPEHSRIHAEKPT